MLIDSLTTSPLFRPWDFAKRPSARATYSGRLIDRTDLIINLLCYNSLHWSTWQACNLGLPASNILVIFLSFLKLNHGQFT